MSNPRVGFFDLETVALIQQSPNWKLRPCKTCGQIPQNCDSGVVIEGNEDNLHSIGMSVAVVRDTSKCHSYVYFENYTNDLIRHLHSLDLIVGYNIRRFDYIILEKYGGTMLKYLPTFDMFLEIKHSINQNISLANLVKRTLNIELDKLGPQSVNKWWDGEKQEIVDYCKYDVEITQKLFNHACKKGYLKYWGHDERSVMSLDTSHWASKARSIVQSEIPDVNCPIKNLELFEEIEEDPQLYLPFIDLNIPEFNYGGQYELGN